ncbi:uncharacterized protein [Magallana gigas]|uniref:Uncharacterized protein n=1 Tax=Magallana gigas TaxID=29159 RepID=A0A8W8NTG2_MAGGI|nr:uncharacterized protein LOC105317264 isoform X1 [Crassostrea gigas]
MNLSEYPQGETTQTADPNLSVCPDTSSPSSNDVDFIFPKSTANWDPRVVDRLRVRHVEEDIFCIVNSKWCLFHLSSADQRMIERCVEACDLKLDYESLDVIAPNIVTPLRTWVNSWRPNEEQLKIIRTEELLKKFETRLDEFSYCLASIVAQRKPNTTLSESKYQTLFKKLLRLFDFYTWSQPFLETEKAMILGKTVSSTADILCCLSDPGIEKPVVCMCDIRDACSKVDESVLQPRKRPRCHSGDSSSTVTTSSGKCSLSPHIGELFVYLDQSVRNEGILGITVERTLVRITYLHIEKSSMEQIKLGNSTGSIELDELNRPVFYYSKPLNFMKQNDRRVLFKALLFMKLMQLKYEKGSA